MIRRVAIINRGEPARRFIHAARELNARRSAPLCAIALHTAAERRATFVREADEAWEIAAPAGGNPYLDHEVLAQAIAACRADAVWVGWGFVAEDAAFADLCARLGVTFIGPSGAVMRALGDKIAAKRLAERVGVPVAPWSGGPISDDTLAREHAERIGYPLLIKAAAGGGGRGIRTVRSPAELLPALARAREEARRSFGDDAVMLEALVEGAHHVEVQVIADGAGGTWAVGVRDCSVQRRSQKVLEESSSPVLSAEQERRLRLSAVALMDAAGYRGAGTVEFLYRPQDQRIAFLEVNTRLQVEHPVTEVTTGLDLVKLQLHVAEGGRLEGEPPPARGHAIEARLNAEDPERGFAPSPGRVELFALPTGPGIRIDAGVGEGDEIPPEYDSMIAKVIAWGGDREEARGRLRRALAELAVVIRGGATNRTFLLDLLDRPEVIAGTADTGWLDRRAAAGDLVADRHADVALVVAAIEAARAEEAIERERFYAAARRGRPKAARELVRAIDLRHRGTAHRLMVARTGPRRYRVRSGEHPPLDVELEALGRFAMRVAMNGRVHRAVVVVHSPDTVVEVDGVSHRVSRDEGGLVRAPAPALVVALPVAVGDPVAAGQPVAVLESMKMETTVAAPCAGRVAELLVAGNVQVDGGAALVRIEPLAGAGTPDDGTPAATSAPVVIAGDPPAETTPADRVGATLAALRSLMLGYDIDEAEARSLVAALGRLPATPSDAQAAEVAAVITLVAIAADIAELARPEAPVDRDGDGAVHNPREHFHRYLRSLDAAREGLPDPLRAALERALAHYGVTNLDRGPALADAVHRLYLAAENRALQLPVIAALIDWLRPVVCALDDSQRARLRVALDRLVGATQRRRPAVAELARGLRFTAFDEPLIEAARGETLREARRALAALSARPDGPDRDRQIAALVASPEPLLPMLGERHGQAHAGDDPLLEVLTRRYYRTRVLRDLETIHRDGRRLLTGVYGRSGRRVRLFTTVGIWEELEGVLAALSGAIAAAPDGAGSVVDVYLAADALGDADATAARIARALDAVALPAEIRRLVVSVAAADGRTGQFTFRPEPGGLREERTTRGLHPMIWRRLRFWRIADFRLERRPAVDGTYLFHCAAPADRADERLVALAEVRDLTPLRSPDGAVALPEVERVLLACLESIRREQVARPQRRRLHANHVLLHVSPPLTIPPEEVVAAARRLAPLTDGLGIEEVVIYLDAHDELTDATRAVAVRLTAPPGAGVRAELIAPPTAPLAPVDDYARRVLAARRRGAVYPYELVALAAGADGEFQEFDLNEAGALEPVERPPGGNRAGIVCGIVRTPTAKHPEGVRRVVLLGDPTRSLGAVAEPECRRVIAALALARDRGLPVEWFALSSGARIARDSGTENMDWVAAALREIVLFTQAGGEINVVVAGINVGAQPYWNAEATMLMHTRGILVMTPDSAMVLTGKQALDYSGGVSAEDNFGLGGFDRIMGPNGQAQYWAPDLAGACSVLMRHYDHSYVAPGEQRPRRAVTADPVQRVLADAPHRGGDFTRVGEIFASETNPERKRPFAMRSLMDAVIDTDHPPLERWAHMADAETAIIYDAHLGGQPLTLVGIESHPIPRHGFLPADGPDQWTAGTLFPLSSKKVARALNAASGNRPAVVLANLSGFDGSPESLRRWQLEYGAEIGRAVVNFRGPLVFCVVSRYHGGAFVVFSAALNEELRVLAVEGSRASVIGGAPAAAVVFAGDVDARTAADPRVVAAIAALDGAPAAERGARRAALAEVRAAVRSEHLGAVAAEFDAIHDIERARRVGSVHDIIPAAELRPRLISAISEGWDTAPAEGISQI